MNNSIYPCLTLKGKVAEAADFYIQTFGDGKIAETSPYVIVLEFGGQKLMLLNDGPTSRPNASVSFMAICETPAEASLYWDKLVQDGKILMPLDSYPWSTRYGWVEDKYGVSWQLYTGSKADTPQKFCPTLMFTGDNAGKAREALQFYTGLFPKSSISDMMEYTEEEADTTGFIKHAQFQLNDYILMALDSSAEHGVTFPESTSLVVNCDTQEEIDHYWMGLTANGGREVACGWLTDKYGLSWQIVPAGIGKLMADPERGQRAMNAMLKMKKLVIADLVNA
jgi:predicted 3-demethylubiquinone-9 3-methyltransferase (glyoxalase superfamily)